MELFRVSSPPPRRPAHLDHNDSSVQNPSCIDAGTTASGRRGSFIGERYGCWVLMCFSLMAVFGADVRNKTGRESIVCAELWPLRGHRALHASLTRLSPLPSCFRHKRSDGQRSCTYWRHGRSCDLQAICNGEPVDDHLVPLG